LCYVGPPFLEYLTPWSRVLLETLAGTQQVKKFPVFYWTRFITVFTRARHRNLSWARCISARPSPPV